MSFNTFKSSASWPPMKYVYKMDIVVTWLCIIMTYACIIIWLMLALAHYFSWCHHFHVWASVQYVPYQSQGVAVWNSVTAEKLLPTTAVLVKLLDSTSHKSAIWFISSRYWELSTLAVSIRVQYTWNCHPARKMNQSVFATVLQGSWYAVNVFVGSSEGL